MKQYNMLYFEKNPGLSIISTPNYRSMLNNEIGLMHINFGDFYSNINPNEMSERISNALTNLEYFNETFHQQLDLPVIIESQNLDDLTEERFYLINLYKNKKLIGTKVYLPFIHKEKEFYWCERAYSRFADKLVESIALENSNMKGTLQKKIERMNKAEKTLKTMTDMLMDANPHLRPN